MMGLKWKGEGEQETMQAPQHFRVVLVDFTLDQSKNRLAPRADNPINQGSKQQNITTD